MERALELPHDVDALHVLVLAHRETIGQQRDEIARLEQQNRVLTKWVFGHSSEKRVPLPTGASLQGHLFVTEIAAEAERLAAEHPVLLLQTRDLVALLADRLAVREDQDVQRIHIMRKFEGVFHRASLYQIEW